MSKISRHLLTRFREHKNGRNEPVCSHFANYVHQAVDLNDVRLLASTNRGSQHLLTLEALFIKEIKQSLNTKDESRSRELTIKF